MGALLLLVIYRPDSDFRSALAVGLVLFLLATDVLDGWLARRLGVTSEFGYLLDGLGDRAVHVSAYLLLVMSGTLSIFVAWVLIFREICQYAVRLIEAHWHESQSRADRTTTRLFTLAVHTALLAELGRTAVQAAVPPFYPIVVNAVLLTVAAAAYFRLLPRIARAWRDAVGR